MPGRAPDGANAAMVRVAARVDAYGPTQLARTALGLTGSTGADTARGATIEATAAMLSVRRRVDASVSAELLIAGALATALASARNARGACRALVTAAPTMLRVAARIDATVCAKRLDLVANGSTATGQAFFVRVARLTAAAAVLVVAGGVRALAVTDNQILRTAEGIGFEGLPPTRHQHQHSQ